LITGTKYLGIDFGLKRIGISVSDESKSYAFQREHLLNDKDIFEKLIKLIKFENVSDIIIGYPLRFNSEKTHSTDDVDKFKITLENFLKKYSLKCVVHFLDERLTSSLAQYNLQSSGLSKKKRQDKGLLDSISAQIILQDYIDSLKNKT
jgi:putative Holliday junction resolvase